MVVRIPQRHHPDPRTQQSPVPAWGSIQPPPDRIWCAPSPQGKVSAHIGLLRVLGTLLLLTCLTGFPLPGQDEGFLWFRLLSGGGGSDDVTLSHNQIFKWLGPMVQVYTETGATPEEKDRVALFFSFIAPHLPNIRFLVNPEQPELLPTIVIRFLPEHAAPRIHPGVCLLMDPLPVFTWTQNAANETLEEACETRHHIITDLALPQHLRTITTLGFQGALVEVSRITNPQVAAHILYHELFHSLGLIGHTPAALGLMAAHVRVGGGDLPLSTDRAFTPQKLLADQKLCLMALSILYRRDILPRMYPQEVLARVIQTRGKPASEDSDEPDELILAQERRLTDLRKRARPFLDEQFNLWLKGAEKERDISNTLADLGSLADSLHARKAPLFGFTLLQGNPSQSKVAYISSLIGKTGIWGLDETIRQHHPHEWESMQQKLLLLKSLESSRLDLMHSSQKVIPSGLEQELSLIHLRLSFLRRKTD